MIQLLWSAVLAGHAMCAAVWWWISPGGFPTSSAAYWLNDVLPAVPIALVALGLFLRGRASETMVPAILAVFPAFWMAFAISLRLAFPSVGSSWNLPFAGGFLLAILWLRQYRQRWPSLWLVLLFVVPATWAGWVLPPTQRAAEPGTHPNGAPLEEPAPSNVRVGILRLSKDAQLHPDDGRLVLRQGPLVLTVQPLLGFADRSADRSSIGAEDRIPTARLVTGLVHQAQHYVLSYKDEDRSLLDVTLHDGAIELDARSRLAAPIYSHANHFAEITLRGHRKLTVSFSPKPGQRIELPPSGAPVRFAYVDSANVFHLVDARKQNLGPFTEILAAPLPADHALAVVLHDGDRAVFRIDLPDFAGQASTQLSPNAGWGVPENAIELMRGGTSDDAAALITFSLAATPVGRGAPSVGHAAGIYRDRLTITPITSPPSHTDPHPTP
jgi:hypothetical protein